MRKKKAGETNKQEVSPKKMSSSDSSVDSDFDPSEFEIVAKQKFPKKTEKKGSKPTASLINKLQSGERAEDGKMSVKGGQVIGKKKNRKARLKAKRALQLALKSTQSALQSKLNSTEEGGKDTGADLTNGVSQSSGKKLSKKKNKDKGLQSLKDSSTVSLKVGHKMPPTAGVPNRSQKSASKPDRMDIFEEAEICIEEAIPKKIEKLKKQLMKGKKSGDGKKKSPAKRKRDYEDLSFKKSRVDVDVELMETTDEGISSGLTGGQKLADKLVLSQDVKLSSDGNKLPDIDPNKFIPVKTQKLRTAVPVFEEGGDTESDEEEQRMNLMEAFADDDIADEFMKEKEEAEEESKPKIVDLRLPGWGSWSGLGIEPKKQRWNKKVIKFPGANRKDKNKKLVIINDDLPASFRKQQVDDLPPEYPSVSAYEASIRAPIGTNWVPQVAHNAIVAAPVVTKMGAIIQPLDESHLVKPSAEEEAQKKFNASIKSGKPTRQFSHKAGVAEVRGHRKPQSKRREKKFKKENRLRKSN